MAMTRKRPDPERRDLSVFRVLALLSAPSAPSCWDELLPRIHAPLLLPRSSRIVAGTPSELRPGRGARRPDAARCGAPARARAARRGACRGVLAVRSCTRAADRRGGPDPVRSAARGIAAAARARRARGGGRAVVRRTVSRRAHLARLAEGALTRRGATDDPSPRIVHRKFSPATSSPAWPPAWRDTRRVAACTGSRRA